MEHLTKKRNRQDDDIVGSSSDIVEPKEVIDKPPCKYGSECYRKNPEHFEKFSHPGVWLFIQRANATHNLTHK